MSKENCGNCKHCKSVKQLNKTRWKWFHICDLLLAGIGGFGVVVDPDKDFCEEWKGEKRITIDNYELVQAFNGHIHIYENGKFVMHINQDEKELTEEYAKDCIELHKWAIERAKEVK